MQSARGGRRGEWGVGDVRASLPGGAFFPLLLFFSFVAFSLFWQQREEFGYVSRAPLPPPPLLSHAASFKGAEHYCQPPVTGCRH